MTEAIARPGGIAATAATGATAATARNGLGARTEANAPSRHGVRTEPSAPSEHGARTERTERTERTGAILLAGGRASRLGGVAKPLLDVGGRSLLARAVDAVHGCTPVTVVAPMLDVPGADALSWVREDPPFGGPAAAIVAALASWGENGPAWTYVLACDLPGVVGAVARLADAVALLPRDTDGVCLADAASRPQWLTGLYRTAALRETALTLPDGGTDAPVRALMDGLALAVIAAPADETEDVDTWEDLKRARERHGLRGS